MHRPGYYLCSGAYATYCAYGIIFVMKNARNLYEKDSARGFTIVELIVIIVVIVILASVVIVSYTAVTRRSQMETAKADAQTAAAAINKFEADTGAYPTALSQVTISKTQSAFNYVPNGTTSYCVDATFKDQVASVKSGTATAAEGACAGNPPGVPATITNVATNPSAEVDLAGVWGYWSGVPRRVGGGAVSGNTSFAVTTNSTSNTQGLIHFVALSGPSRTYTCAMSFKGTDGVTIAFAGRFTTAADAYISEGAGQKTLTLSSTSWTRKTITFTTPANTGRLNVQYKVTTAASGVTIESDALMCTESLTDYNYADGDSANWAWSGARQQSASSGPTTGVAPAN